MRRICNLPLAAIPVLSLAITVSAIAQGETVKIPSEVTIKEKSSLRFKGKVKADNPSCVEHREVVLKRVFEDGSSEKAGSAEADNDGAWKITPEGSAGISMSSFFAKVKRVEQGTAGTIYVCKGAKSETIQAGSG